MCKNGRYDTVPLPKLRVGDGMKCDLNGQVAIVTGAAGAIGQAIAARLADNDATVVVADIDAEGARSVASRLRNAVAATADITDMSSFASTVEETASRFGHIDILVNNAGINSTDHRVCIDEFAPEVWDEIVRVDLDGLFKATRAALPAMIMYGNGGRVVNIASVVGMAAMRLQSPFNAAKAGVIHLTRAMALELGPKGILANAVAPGSVISEPTRRLFYGEDGTMSDRVREFMAHIGMSRPARPSEIAEAVLFLCSPHSSYINGQVLAVDGGWSTGFRM